MAKSILLYGPIWEYQAMFFFDQIKEAQEDDPEAELELLINCEGGNPGYGMSIIRKMQEMPETKIIVEGMAHSMALFLLAYVNPENVSGIDTLQAVLHRATFGEWYEQSSYFKGSIDEKILAKTNKDLEKAWRARVDVEALEALPQFTEAKLKLKDIFSMESRHEVLLTAQDLKKLGLISKIIKVTPSKIEAVNKITEAFKTCKTIGEFKMAAQVKPKPAATKEDDHKTPTNMDLTKLKAEHPALYAQIFAEGRAEGITAGIAQEKDRVESIMVFAHLDLEAAKKAVEEGKPLSEKQKSEFSLKAIAATKLDDIKKDSAGKIVTEGGEKEKTDKQKQLEAFEAGTRKILGLKAAS